MLVAPCLYDAGMGLAVSVGNPCIGSDEEGEERYRRKFGGLAAALAAEGHAWTLPEGPVPSGLARRDVSSFPYSVLHYLRRAHPPQGQGGPGDPGGGGGPG